MLAFLSRYWWVLVVRGVFAILFGILAYWMPGVTLATLLLVFGAFAFADGIAAIVTVLGGRRLTSDWWIQLVQGLLGIGAGLLTFFSPGTTAVALLLYIAAWALVSGVLQVIAAIKLRHQLTGEWWLVLGGLLSAAFGIAMAARPGAGALAVIWMIAAYAIVWGVMLILGGFAVRRAGKLVRAV